jgi:nucleoside phosphorylase
VQLAGVVGGIVSFTASANGDVLADSSGGSSYTATAPSTTSASSSSSPAQIVAAARKNLLNEFASQFGEVHNETYAGLVASIAWNNICTYANRNRSFVAEL